MVNAYSGNEDSVAGNIVKKVASSGLGDLIKDIKVVKEVVRTEEEVTRDEAPQNLRNTKTTSWVVLPNGNYNRITTRTKNKFPGYIYLKTVMSDEVWYQIRNTSGVTGIIGSSGAGMKPIPVTVEEIAPVFGLAIGATVEAVGGEFDGKKGVLLIDARSGDAVVQLSASRKEAIPLSQLRVVAQTVNPDKPEPGQPAAAAKAERVKAHFEVGNTVTLKTGEMAGMVGVVASINEDKGTAVVNVDLFGRETEVEAVFADVEISA